ncbi:TonB-dependent receptor [Sphingomonas corticis]|uniref:TonB-dependent receptor n=1 Tax=Sphingomonas corticis TaxID=2722791 RepID=A0ABX1CUJ0_9SPHN|nr:TonB-dependent receptor [Sphingomonas corticis]NJR80077.1 TonB-dependent receptor [Sphingomonas corticis]
MKAAGTAVRNGRILAMGTALAGALTCQVAMAQTPTQAPGAPPAEAEIIVQALRQNEGLLETPVTVSVVAQDDLTTSNVTNARDLNGIVPGFTLMQGTAGGSASFRGLGSNLPDPAAEASVGAFLDGVYLGHARDFTTPLYDVQQIEFVAGTQSTLLGKNTSLGAVSITSRRPGDVLAFEGSATYVGELDAVIVRAGADVPLGSGLALRLAGFFNDEQGYTRNVLLGRDEQQLRDASGRAILEGALGERVRLTAIYQHDIRRGDGQYLELLNDPDGLARSFSETVLGVDEFDATPDDRHVNGGDRLDPALGEARLPVDDQDTDRATAILEFDTTGGSTLTAQTGYTSWSSSRRLDQDYTPLLVLDQLDDEDNEVFSQELRFASPASLPFSVVLGLYYYHNDYSLHRRIESDLGENLDAFSNIVTDAYSAFAAGRYRLGGFSVLAGIRHNLEDKRASYDISGTLASPIAPVTLPATTSNETDYNLGLEYRPGPELLLYATYARGSKNGGFQSVPDDLSLARYGTEVTRSLEVGAKYDLGRDGSFEVAAFDTRVDGFQAGRLVTLEDSPLPVSQISNVDARTTGIESTLRWRPVGGLRVSAALAYIDARFTEPLVSEVEPGVFVTEITDGMRLVRAPRWSGRFTADYSASVGAGLELSANAIVRYQSEADLQFRASNPGAPIQREHAIADLEIRLGDASGAWSVAAIGNNLTNIRITEFTSDWLLSGLVDPTGTPAYYGRRNRPRTISIQLATRF